MNTRGHLVSDTDSKHSPTPSKINTKPHPKDPLISVPCIQYSLSSFEQKFTSRSKR